MDNIRAIDYHVYEENGRMVMEIRNQQQISRICIQPEQLINVPSLVTAVIKVYETMMEKKKLQDCHFLLVGEDKSQKYQESLNKLFCAKQRKMRPTGEK